MYICLLLLNEIVYQIQGLYLHYGTQVCFHVAYKIHGLWAAQSSEMLLFPLPEGYPNIEAVNGSPRKEVCDMKFKIIVFKFVVSRLGFYHACQTFASFFFFFLLWACYTNVDFIYVFTEGNGDSATLWVMPLGFSSARRTQNAGRWNGSWARRKEMEHTIGQCWEKAALAWCTASAGPSL